MSRKVYSPADTATTFTYRAHKFTLAPNEVQEIKSPWGEVSSSQITDHALGQLEKLGLREVFGDDRDEAIKAEAEKVHIDWLCDVAGEPRPKPAVDDHVAAARASLARRGVISDKERG